MDFSQPQYRFPYGALQLDITFTFKKSVFFADYVIICLGTGISSTNSDPHITQVGCFVSSSFHQEQDKVNNPSRSASKLTSSATNTSQVG